MAARHINERHKFYIDNFEGGGLYLSQYQVYDQFPGGISSLEMRSSVFVIASDIA